MHSQRCHSLSHCCCNPAIFCVICVSSLPKPCILSLMTCRAVAQLPIPRLPLHLRELFPAILDQVDRGIREPSLQRQALAWQSRHMLIMPHLRSHFQAADQCKSLRTQGLTATHLHTLLFPMLSQISKSSTQELNKEKRDHASQHGLQVLLETSQRLQIVHMAQPATNLIAALPKSSCHGTVTGTFCVAGAMVAKA